MAVTSSWGRPIPITERRYRCITGRGSSSFFFDSGTTLRNFYTSCRSWRTPDNTRVGNTITQATEQEHQPATPACGNGSWIVKAGRAQLYVAFASEKPSAKVASLAVASLKAGLLGC